MDRIFLKEKKEPQKTGRGVWNGMRVILSLCIMLSVSVLSISHVFAAEDAVQKVRVMLVDAEYGDGLAGGRFTLAKCENGSYENMTDQTEIMVADTGYDFGTLEAGMYQLTEVTAPAGYIIGSLPVEFEVMAEGVVMTNSANAVITQAEDGTYEITVSNAAFLVKLPSTGGIGTVPYTLGGVLLIAAAFACGVVLRSKREN